MELLKYLEPMKNLPERFSNLAFWRGVRKLKDEVVNAFEYVDSWGKNIESELDNLLTDVQTVSGIPIEVSEGGGRKISNTQYGVYVRNNTPFNICDIPPNVVSLSVTCHITYKAGSAKYSISPINYTRYNVVNGKLQGTWIGSGAVFYDPALTREIAETLTSPNLVYDVIFTVKK